MVPMKLLCLTLTLFVSPVVFAQEPVVGVADPEALFHNKDKKLDANMQVVMHIMRDLLEANHWEDAPKYLSARYLQHNPNVASGLDPVMKFFGNNPNRPKTAIPDKNSWKTKVVAVTATGDYVTVAIAREYPDPRNPGKTYTSTWFDMWRIMDGKADEHWDAATIAAPNPNNKK
jgi:predicted SnoaL-like aldol condensation-catalyzing enzyme